ncbi:MAG: prepilin-type N-terminal cleavage/methylation domain-containing protein [Pirellulales bacterium]
MMRSEERGVRGQGTAARGLAGRSRSGATAGSSSSAKRVPGAHCWTSQQCHPAQASGSSQPPAPSPQPRRRGVTLVELLITIAIIAILATAILGVAAVATTTAREARTRNTITRLHTLLTEHYDTYKMRRVKLNPALETIITAHVNMRRPEERSRVRGEMLATARLYALRELMLMEMPDRWSDIVFDNVQNVSAGAPWRTPLYCAERTGLSSLYRRHYDRLLATATPTEIAQNQSAECLYLTIMHACGDGESRAQFAETDIGDTDGDGAPEFVDSWGKPIQFLRWAPGFDSDAQLSPQRLAQIKADAAAKDPMDSDGSKAVAKALASDHDPFDMFRREADAFRLVPLIYSAGSDELYGIETRDAEQVWYTGNMTAPTAVAPPLYFAPRLSPYIPPTMTPTNFTGTPIDSARFPNTADATDNIHNHLIGTR